MTDQNLPPMRHNRPARLFWILGMVIGILAGSFVAFGIANNRSHQAESQG